MKGVFVNFLAIIAGAFLGLLMKQGIPIRYKKTIMQALGLAVFLIGIKMALVSENIIIVILSLALGALVGEFINIDSILNRFGAKVTEKFGRQYGDVGKGLITASLVFCIGAMAIVGSIQAGLTGDASIIYAKALIDGIAAVIFAATMGIGVVFSAFPVLLYQGAITIGAGFFGDVVSTAMIHELSGVGGILIVAISLSMLEIVNIKTANLLPAIPLAVFFVWLGWL